jgi:biopolymer transport protein TolR
MSMSVSRSAAGRQKAEMNVTPMIDVLLVLIIIFMVVTTHTSGLKANIPQPSDDSSALPNHEVVLTVLANDTVQLNRERPIPVDDLDPRLRGLFKNAAHHVIFVRGAKDLDFARIAQVIDIAKGAGLDRFALMTE